MVAEEHIVAFGWANQQDLDDMVALALRVNDFLSGVMMGVGIRLADFRIEVGRIWEGDFMRLIVADEISPDSCRLWDLRGPDGDRPRGAGPRGRPAGRCLYRTGAPAGGPALERHPYDQTDPDQLKGQADESPRPCHAERWCSGPAGRGRAPRAGHAWLCRGVDAVRQGKVIELDLAATDRAAAEAEVRAMCESCWPIP
jgi:hypothetical protein